MPNIVIITWNIMEIHPVKIVSLTKVDHQVNNKHKLIFHKDIFDNVISKLDPNMEVSVITINGAYRSGKSFVLNFIAEELYKNTSYEINQQTYKWVHGKNLGTTGMWMLDSPVVLKLNEKNVAVLLIDTQGIFDTELDIEATTALFGLSTLISSLQIYNLDKRIQEDNLQHLALFSEYAKIITKEFKDMEHIKPFQHLNILVRDWQNFSDINNLEKIDKDTMNYLYEILNTDKKSNDLVETRNQIIKCYTNITCTLLPHPGYNVAEGYYNGNIKDVREAFVTHVHNYVHGIKNVLCSKKILGRTILLGELSTYITKYAIMLQDDTLPKPKTILSTTVEILYLNTIFYSLQYYQDRMNTLIKNNGYISLDKLFHMHSTYEIESLKFFDSKAIMGSEQCKLDARNILSSRITKYYEECKSINESKKSVLHKYLWIITIFIIVWLCGHFTSNICTLQICKSINVYFMIIFYCFILYFMYQLLLYFNVNSETVKSYIRKLKSR